jgi:hypothetical protein
VDSSTTVNAFKWSFTDAIKYNIYDKVATKHVMSLVPPGFYETNVSFGYTVEKSAVQQSDGSITFIPTNEKTAVIATTLTKPISTTYSLGEREVQDSTTPKDYRQKIALIYASPSKCWGLSMSREKGYITSERDATYLLQLSVIFTGQSRDFDVSPGLNREIKKDQT